MDGLAAAAAAPDGYDISLRFSREGIGAPQSIRPSLDVLGATSSQIPFL